MQERPRNQALDAWDYRSIFRPFHIEWEEGKITPAFEAVQAYATVYQELQLGEIMKVWAHREVFVNFSSDHIKVAKGPALLEPAWIVIVAGIKLLAGPDGGLLEKVAPGGGAVLQALVHGRTGEILLGTALPVELRQG